MEKYGSQRKGVCKLNLAEIYFIRHERRFFAQILKINKHNFIHYFPNITTVLKHESRGLYVTLAQVLRPVFVKKVSKILKLLHEKLSHSFI
jgi:hypothetical protein